MPINSKQKGKRGELELAKLLTSYGFEARRGQQFKGGEDSPDIICDKLSHYNIECKRTERLQLYKALEQCIDDCGYAQKPLIFHRQSNKDWVTVLKASDFLELQQDVERLVKLISKVMDEQSKEEEGSKEKDRQTYQVQT